MSQVATNNTVIRHRGRRSVAAGVLATALLAVVPATQAAAGQDLRSPDTRDAADASVTTKGQDLRSPDARDAAGRSAGIQGRDLHSPDTILAARAPEARTYQDLRSPDARDAGREIASSSRSGAPSSEAGGWDWGMFGIAAGGVLVLMLLGLGGRVLLNGRRAAPGPESPVAER